MTGRGRAGAAPIRFDRIGAPDNCLDAFFLHANRDPLRLKISNRPMKIAMNAAGLIPGDMVFVMMADIRGL